MIQKLEKAVQRVGYLALYVSMALLAGVMFFTAVDVVGRYFGHPIQGSYQISELILVWIVCLSWPYLTEKKGHVRVEMLVSKLPPRMQGGIGLLTHLLGLCVFGLIVWQGIEMVKMSIRMNEQVGIIDISLYPFQIVVPLGALLVCPVLLIQLIQLVTRQKREGE